MIEVLKLLIRDSIKNPAKGMFHGLIQIFFGGNPLFGGKKELAPVISGPVFNPDVSFGLQTFDQT